MSHTTLTMFSVCTLLFCSVIFVFAYVNIFTKHTCLQFVFSVLTTFYKILRTQVVPYFSTKALKKYFNIYMFLVR